MFGSLTGNAKISEKNNEPVIRLFLIDLRVSVCVGRTSKCANWKRKRIRRRA